MHQEVERPPFFLDRREGRIEGDGIGHVAMTHQQPAKLLRQRLDPPLQRIALMGESDIGALRPARFGDAPGDRAVIGNSHDQAALAAHEARGFRHALLAPLAASGLP
jgi:hypothetical protein